MRADLKDVIVNTGRRKYGVKRTHSLAGLKEEQIDALPEKQSIRRNHTDWGFEFGDRTKPLYNFLKSNAGRPWNDVFSEICEHADLREVRGKHLREHALSYVQGSGGPEASARWYTRPFYVDEGGILRYNGQRRWKSYKPRYDPDKCQIDDDIYERINGCWFQTWYEKVEKSHQRWNFAMSRAEPEYFYEDVRVRQKQLSKKELKVVGLSNDPNFEWWNNGRAKQNSR